MRPRQYQIRHRIRHYQIQEMRPRRVRHLTALCNFEISKFKLDLESLT
jgi:hypothetical protein